MINAARVGVAEGNEVPADVCCRLDGNVLQRDTGVP